MSLFKIIQQTHVSQCPKASNPDKKWLQKMNRHFCEKKHIGGQQAHEKNLNITKQQEKDKSKPQGDITSHSAKCILSKTTNNKYWHRCGEKKPPYIVWRNANQCSHYEKQNGDFLKNLKQHCQQIQQFHSYIFMQGK